MSLRKNGVGSSNTRLKEVHLKPPQRDQYGFKVDQWFEKESEENGKPSDKAKSKPDYRVDQYFKAESEPASVSIRQGKHSAKVAITRP